MRDKLNRFIDNLNGQFVEVSYRDAIYQCLDLVYNWVFVLDFPKATIQHQYAYEVFTQASDFTREYFDIIPNRTETIPQEGDIVVWNKTSSNIAGHIAIVIEATQTKMKVFEQNSPLGTNAHISDKTYTNCLGFLRPKFKAVGGIPQYLSTLLQEAGLKIDEEASIRAFWEKAKKYDEDTKALRTQLVTANESLSNKSTELSNEIAKVDSLQATVDELTEKLNKKGSELDSITSEKIRLEIQNEDLVKKLDEAEAKIDELQEGYPLKTYSWITRFKSLFGL